MRQEQKVSFRLSKTHLSILHLIVALAVVCIYINEASSLLKGISIAIYFLSLWFVFAFKEVRIMMEKEEQEADDIN